MKRGSIWIAAGRGAYSAKPRPVVILQSDDFDKTLSVTVVPLTSDPTDAPLARPEIAPSASNGLQAASRLMVDKITTLPRHRLGRQVGALSSEEMNGVDRAAILFLGLGG